MHQTRSELLRAAVDQVRRTGDTTVPWDHVPGLAEEFGSPDNLLRELHRRWYARLFARLDALLEDPPGDVRGAVALMWEELVAEDPARHALLDAHRGHPALRDAEERQRRLLDLATVSGGRGAGTALRDARPPGDRPRVPGRHDPVRR